MELFLLLKFSRNADNVWEWVSHPTSYLASKTFCCTVDSNNHLELHLYNIFLDCIIVVERYVDLCMITPHDT